MAQASPPASGGMGDRRDASEAGGISAKMGMRQANRDGLSCALLLSSVPRSTQRCRIELSVRVGGQDGQDEKVLGGEFRGGHVVVDYFCGLVGELWGHEN